MRYLLMFMLLVPGIVRADESLNKMYDAFNGDYNLRESHRQRLNSYANSGQSWDGLIAQIQMAKQVRLQGQMVEEMQRQNDYTESAMQREREQKEERDYRQSWLFYCSHNPTNLRCK